MFDVAQSLGNIEHTKLIVNVANLTSGSHTVSRVIAVAAAMLLSASVQANDKDKVPPKPSDYASSSGQMIGDQVRIKSDVKGFEVVGAPESNPAKQYCAGEESELRINGRNNHYTFVEFKEEKEIKNPGARKLVCTEGTEMVQTGVTYRISNDTFDWVRKKTSGVAFGALVVPFKFRLGSDSKLISSSTIAPYVGYRFKGLQGASMEAIPIISAGLGIIPVNNPVTDETETKTGLSTSVGFIFTSEKSSSFNAGILIGKDFLDRADRIKDPGVSKPWVSIWLGVAVK